MDRHFDFVFENDSVRIITDEYGNNSFVASDIAKVLGYRDAYNMTRNLEQYEYIPHIVSTLGGDQNMLVITEAGLYHAIILSRKPNAKVFQRWIFNEVLPSIRNFGAYVDIETRNALGQNPNLIHDLNSKIAELERKANLVPLYHIIDKSKTPFKEFGKLEDVNTKLKESLKQMEDKYYDMYMQARGVNQMFDHFVSALSY